MGQLFLFYKMEEKRNIKSYTYSDLEDILVDAGFPKFRAEQLFREIYLSNRSNFDEVSMINKELRQFLKDNFEYDAFKDVKKQVSVDGSVKFLFKLHDGNRIESVYMPWQNDDEDKPERTTICVSSQVGCGLDCKFCATGTLGLTRNLSTEEIVDQVLVAERYLEHPITNIVFMGMGEPLLNFNSVIRSIEILSDKELTKIRRKKITVSTSGVIPRIPKLTQLDPPVKLALSLHATTNGVRDKIVPLNEKSNISELMNKIENYYRETKLPITYEYIPFDGLNDTIEDAKRLAKIAKRVPSRVNIIPFNDISFTNPTGISAELKASPSERISEFANEIRMFGGTVTVRDTFGKDIDAACGQLALSNRDENV